MRIVHGSDWHWSFSSVPEADLYVFTGDMLDDYPIINRSYGLHNWKIDPVVEVKEQNKAIKKFVSAGGFSQFLGSPKAPVICVRGNHDFVDLAPLFEGCNLVHEFVNNEVIEVLGKKASGHRGIPYIYGEWNDEMHRPDLMDRVRNIPSGIDLLLTHYPPSQILDAADYSRRGATHYGMEGMGDVVLSRMNSGSYHFFGHIHEQGGKTLAFEEENISFSNAATTFNVIDV